MNQPVRLMSVVAAFALFLAACSANNQPSDPGETTTLSVTGTDTLRFEPDEFTVTAGEAVTAELSAEEAVDHTFTIEEAAQGADLTVAEASAGETATGTFIIDEAGTFEVFCSIPGHREAGMVATLSVAGD